jgi:Protein of unknown function (DUF1656)
MIGEIDVYGVFVPPLLLWVAASLPIVALLRRLLARVGWYRFVWHRPLFDLALLIIVLGGVVAVTSRWFSP